MLTVRRLQDVSPASWAPSDDDPVDEMHCRSGGDMEDDERDHGDVENCCKMLDSSPMDL